MPSGFMPALATSNLGFWRTPVVNFHTGIAVSFSPNGSPEHDLLCRRTVLPSGHLRALPANSAEAGAGAGEAVAPAQRQKPPLVEKSGLIFEGVGG
jgi:hypothetical protein